MCLIVKLFVEIFGCVSKLTNVVDDIIFDVHAIIGDVADGHEAWYVCIFSHQKRLYATTVTRKTYECTKSEQVKEILDRSLSKKKNKNATIVQE